MKIFCVFCCSNGFVSY